MTQLPAIVKKSKQPDSVWHIGGVSSFMTPLAKHFPKMLKAVFVELFDFCELFSGEFFAYNLKK